MASLLIHSEQTPAAARDALRAAYDAPPEHRRERLRSAARILRRETGLDCADIQQLVDLPGAC